ncbi:MAG: transcriptional regulator PpsR [Betaproteobacteria bacterium TMED156]|nr:MAG: transcriptional regulator PpsR [Betaproteobacteria bacterium TMED156]
MSNLDQQQSVIELPRNLNQDSIDNIFEAASDITLFLDPNGVIKKASAQQSEISRQCKNWLGKSWAQIVTSESKPKVAELLNFSIVKPTQKWRHINHHGLNGSFLPMLFSTIKVLNSENIVAMGRDLSGLAKIQQNLVEAQQSLEREYIRLRQLETRYRTLFEMTSSPVFVVNADDLKIAEANSSAVKIPGKKHEPIIGKKINSLFHLTSSVELQQYLAKVRNSFSQQEPIRLKLRDKSEIDLTGSLFKLEGSSYFLIHCKFDNLKKTNNSQITSSKILTAIESIPDGFVLTSEKGEIVFANSAFSDMLDVPNSESLINTSLSNWFIRGRIDLNVMSKTLKKHGVLRLFSSDLAAPNSPIPVEISAVILPVESATLFALVIRSTARRIQNKTSFESSNLSQSMEQLSELVGKLPLKEIVGETTDVIEKMCIESALILTDNNRASAAEMLGLSRQSLYVKLRRFKISE